MKKKKPQTANEKSLFPVIKFTCACGHCSRPQLSVAALRTLERAQRFIHSAVAATHSLMAPSSTVQHTLLTPLFVQRQQLELEYERGSVSLHLAECERLVCVKTLKKRETWCLAEEQQTTVVKNAGGPMMGR